MPHCGGCAGTLRVRNGRSIYEYFQRKEVPDMNEKITAHPQKEEREKVLNEIRQLKNRKKILENKQRNEERRVRTRRLIERGAVLEGIFPAGSRPFRRGGQSVPDCPVPSSGGCGIDCKTAKIRGHAISPLFTRAHLYTVAGAVRPAGGCCVLRPRWEATLPKPLVRSAQPNTRFAFVRLHRACYPLTERRCSP